MMSFTRIGRIALLFIFSFIGAVEIHAQSDTKIQVKIQGHVFEEKNRKGEDVQKYPVNEFAQEYERGLKAKTIKEYSNQTIIVDSAKPFIQESGSRFPGVGGQPTRYIGRQQNIKLQLVTADQNRVEVLLEFNQRPAVRLELRPYEITVVPVGPLDQKDKQTAFFALQAIGVVGVK